jgi:hypothetical protein
VERLAAEVAEMARETKTEAIRRALEERKARLAVEVAPKERLDQLVEYLERKVWPHLHPDLPESASRGTNAWFLDVSVLISVLAGEPDHPRLLKKITQASWW